ncbi:hypothetical protein J3R30DRAFT_3800738 [Lentinula aciculospora]|uniref:Uncharacterized protein n=1 Tax=Lentinula aciculospora TaxID=153920 RepID=A0A9W9A0C9_9AGAR|nr:hypothetical protein J3R30DRAFT_3800738 [Lentinula aciculospora]
MSSSHNPSSYLLRRLVPKSLRVRTTSDIPAIPAVPTIFPSFSQTDFFQNTPRDAPRPPTRPPRPAHSLYLSSQFSHIAEPHTDTPTDPVVTYHTNYLGLFSGEGETPIVTTLPPRLTDLVPPIQVHPSEYEPTLTVEGGSQNRPSGINPEIPDIPQAISRVNVIQDYDYVGGWVVDESGKQQYVARGRIEEVVDEDEKDEGRIEGTGSNTGANAASPFVIPGRSSIPGPSSRFLDAISLPGSTTPPPRPSLHTKRDLPFAQSPLVPLSPETPNHGFQRSSTKHPLRHPSLVSPLSQSVSSLAPLPLRGFSSLHSAQQPIQVPGVGDTDTEMPFEPYDPLADSLSSLPGLRGFSYFTPQTERISEENITSTPELTDIPNSVPVSNSARAAGALESLGNSLESLSPPVPPPKLPVFSSAGAPAVQAPLIPIIVSDEPMYPLPPSPAPAPHTPIPYSSIPHIGDLSDPIIIQPLDESTPNGKNRNGDGDGKGKGREKGKEIQNDEHVQIEENERLISYSIQDIVGMVRGVRATLSSISPFTVTVIPYQQMCTRIEESLERVGQSLVRRRQMLKIEESMLLSGSGRKRYEKRLGSLKRCLRRLSDIAKRIVEPGRHLDVLLKKLGEHYDKLTNVADKLEDTFDRLTLQHLYAVASKLTEEANRSRGVYMNARDTYTRRKDMKKDMKRKSIRGLREEGMATREGTKRRRSIRDLRDMRDIGSAGKYRPNNLTKKKSRLGLGLGGLGGDRPPRALRPTRPYAQPGVGSH